MSPGKAAQLDRRGGVNDCYCPAVQEHMQVWSIALLAVLFYAEEGFKNLKAYHQPRAKPDIVECTNIVRPVPAGVWLCLPSVSALLVKLRGRQMHFWYCQTAGCFKGIVRGGQGWNRGR